MRSHLINNWNEYLPWSCENWGLIPRDSLMKIWPWKISFFTRLIFLSDKWKCWHLRATLGLRLVATNFCWKISQCPRLKSCFSRRLRLSETHLFIFPDEISASNFSFKTTQECWPAHMKILPCSGWILGAHALLWIGQPNSKAYSFSRVAQGVGMTLQSPIWLGTWLP